MTDSTQPIVTFVNPAVFIDPGRPVRVPGGGFIRGLRTVAPQPNANAAHLNELVRATAGPVVLTDAWGGPIPIGGGFKRYDGDMRDRLHQLGFRLYFPPAWLIDRTAPDLAAAIGQWLEAHGDPPCIVIDRPGTIAPGVLIALEPGSPLTVAAYRHALAVLVAAGVPLP